MPHGALGQYKLKPNTDHGIARSYPSSFESGPLVVDIEFPSLSLGSDRAQQLSENGTFMASLLDRIFPNLRRWSDCRHH